MIDKALIPIITMLILCPAAIGVVFVFRITRYPDLTADGSFALGGATAVMSILGNNPIVSILFALLSGAIAGAITASLHVFFKINKILSGILVMTSLYSIVFFIMKSGYTPVPIDKNTLFSLLGSSFYAILALILMNVIIIFILYKFLNTEIGLHVRACGINPNLIEDLSRNNRMFIIAGPAIANALIALSGGLFTSYNGFADVNMGNGILILGLAMLLIGNTIINNDQPFPILLSAIVGAGMFELITYLILYFMTDTVSLTTEYQKIVTAGLLLFFILLSRIRNTRFQLEELF